MDIISFIITYFILTPAIIFVARVFLFGQPADGLTLAYAIGGGIGFAVARFIAWGIEKLIRKKGDIIP